MGSSTLKELLDRRGGTKKGMEELHNMSEKEALLAARREGLLTPLQTTTVARAMDKGQSLTEALNDLEAGELPIGAHDKRAKKNLLRLADVRESGDSHGPKQELLILRDAGSITPVQTRKAARMVTQGLSVEQALAAVDASHLLETVPAPAETEEVSDETNEADPETNTPDGETDDEPGEDGPGDDDGTVSTEPVHPPENVAETSTEPGKQDKEARPSTIAGLMAGTVKELKDALEKMKSKAGVTQLFVHESMKDDPRKTALEAIVDKAADLGVDEESLEGALDLARKPHGE